MLKFLIIILVFLFYHWLYIGLGFLFFYFFHLNNIGHYLVCVGLAPMFGHPKQLYYWVVENCPYPTNNGMCNRFTCPHFTKCEYSLYLKSRK